MDTHSPFEETSFIDGPLVKRRLRGGGERGSKIADFETTQHIDTF